MYFLNVRCWQTGMDNGASHLIPVSACLSFQPGLGSVSVGTSLLHPRKYPEVCPVKEAAAQSEAE